MHHTNYTLENQRRARVGISAKACKLIFSFALLAVGWGRAVTTYIANIQFLKSQKNSIICMGISAKACIFLFSLW